MQINYSMQISLKSQQLKTKGNLVYEYHPFRNYRLPYDIYYFRDKYFTKEEYNKEIKNRPIQTNEQQPILYEAGTLFDFNTDKLNFDIQHPINITPQWSYDGSVNLIINDNSNVPKLINSRFSALGQNKYQIVDRKGNNDTNIYNEDTFDTDTSLYKSYNEIPKITFLGEFSGGNLQIGTYYFYFKYADADGNETDFIGESGLVSVFKGINRDKVNTGFENENSHKLVSFELSNLDPGFSYINVYYTRSSAQINQSKTTTAHKISKSYLIGSDYTCNISITGNESIEPITIEEINLQYFQAETVKTQAICQNRLFFGNVSKAYINYKELADLSLHFTPKIYVENYNGYDPTYSESINNTYYDPLFIYNKVGYQKNEIYRFGVVYILSNNTLSPVFNIRGAVLNTENFNYANFDFINKDTGEREYIQYDESTGIILGGKANLENIYGITKIYSSTNELTNIYGITITPDNGLKEWLIKNKVKGYFFVRQNRIPLRICQALTIGVYGDKGMPVPITRNGYFTEKFHTGTISQKNKDLNKVGIANDVTVTLSNNVKYKNYRVYQQRINKDGKNSKLEKFGAFCPDYDINYITLNSLFCGETYEIKSVTNQLVFDQDLKNKRIFYIPDVSYSSDSAFRTSQILGVEDGVQQVGLNSKLYTSKIGNAKELRYSSTLDLDKNLFSYRAIYGPYLALDSYNKLGHIINIYYPNVSQPDIEQLKMRISDQGSYQAISDRYSIDELSENTYFRGDSYICTFTHRLNRNFTNDSAPTNDIIVDGETLKTYINEFDDKDKEHTINMGDLNAVDIGTWFTFPIVSNYNLNIRSLDESNTDEMKITNHARGFYPYYDTIALSSYKIPEALCYNQGFAKSTSDRYNFELSNSPAIKNDFSNRIYYSNKNITDAFKNGLRVFQDQSYRDYPKTYGSITKLLEISGNLLCVFEHGIALIPVNERVQTGEGDGGNIYINTNNVLPENPKIISDTIGSQWQDSIIKTDNGIYGVDTVAKKIWKIASDSVECISDFCIQEFLNNNITLTEQETTPYIGIRNVKTHYNALKKDVIFTFYDNLENNNETCWSVCYNELLKKWITFYSWIPSYSENLYNSFFSFDRETSKAIAMLGAVTNGIVPESNIISYYKDPVTGIIGDSGTITTLNVVGKPYDIEKVTYEIEHDPFGNYKNFKVVNVENLGILRSESSYTSLCSDFYQRAYDINNNSVDIEPNSAEWKAGVLGIRNTYIKRDESGNKKLLDTPINPDNIVIYLNLKATITYNVKIPGGTTNVTQTIRQTIALITNWNMQFLTTSFWKHGQSGIIDNVETIKPTRWYGKQHPFEFEFVVADRPEVHKVFNNMQIVSNKAKPESFHYEIIGEVYDFSKDKKNMYFRQEAIKSIWNYNGINISYDTNFSNLELSQNVKSADLVHTYYDRQAPVNQVYDYYVSATNDSGYDYSHLSGGEIVKYNNRNEYRIMMHTKAVALEDQKDTTNDYYGGRGLIASNMRYLEDIWYVQINPLQVKYRNEYENNVSTWCTSPENGKKIPPLSIFNSPIPKEIKEAGTFELPKEGLYSLKGNTNANYYIDNHKWVLNEVAIKDKFMKVKIRYKGDELAIINFIKTLYEISYA